MNEDEIKEQFKHKGLIILTEEEASSLISILRALMHEVEDGERWVKPHVKLLTKKFLTYAHEDYF